MDNPTIRSVEELQRDVNILKEKVELMKRERTALSKNINSSNKQIEKLEQMIIDNNQFEMF